VVTQDALGGAVYVLVVARSVLSEPLERPSLQSYRSGHRRHEQSLSTPTETHGSSLLRSQALFRAGCAALSGCSLAARYRSRLRAAGSQHQAKTDETVILDEAGMVDHKRLDAVTELVERSGAKLIAVGDGKQLPSIGPGGMFDRIALHAPTVELADIHRTKDPAEQRAWQALRAGEPERAMAHYASRGRLHLPDTRDQAAEHGRVSTIHEQGVTVTLDGSQRKIQLARKDLDSLRLAYAQHVYRQQGATVERSVVLTGGWQTSKETAYVEATRARHGTDWFIARDDLGTEGQDAARIKRLAQQMRNSRAQTPSIAHPELPDPEWGSGFRIPIAPSRRSRIPGITRAISRIAQPDRTPGRTR
jgi:ATP-dependent exoDNAse (exonuclease V) alpha subunit